MGFFGVPRWHETAGNKEKQREKDKETEKEETLYDWGFLQIFAFFGPASFFTGKSRLGNIDRNLGESPDRAPFQIIR